jgi:hypothetical protein
MFTGLAISQLPRSPYHVGCSAIQRVLALGLMHKVLCGLEPRRDVALLVLLDGESRLRHIQPVTLNLQSIAECGEGGTTSLCGQQHSRQVTR